MKHGKHLRKKENRAGRSVWHRCLAVLLSAAMLAGVMIPSAAGAGLGANVEFSAKIVKDTGDTAEAIQSVDSGDSFFLALDYKFSSSPDGVSYGGAAIAIQLPEYVKVDLAGSVVTSDFKQPEVAEVTLPGGQVIQRVTIPCQDRIDQGRAGIIYLKCYFENMVTPDQTVGSFNSILFTGTLTDGSGNTEKLDQRIDPVSITSMADQQWNIQKTVTDPAPAGEEIPVVTKQDGYYYVTYQIAVTDPVENMNRYGRLNCEEFSVTDTLPAADRENGGAQLVSVGYLDRSSQFQPLAEGDGYTKETNADGSLKSLTFQYVNTFDQSMVTEGQVRVPNGSLLPTTYQVTVKFDAAAYQIPTNVPFVRAVLDNQAQVSYKPLAKDAVVKDSSAKVQVGDVEDKTTPVELIVEKTLTIQGDGLAVSDNTFVLNGEKQAVYGSAQFTLYSDPECTQVAKDIDGSEEAGAGRLLDGTGRVKFSNLRYGTYYLKETQTPDGFTGVGEAIQVTLNQDGTVTAGGKTLQKGEALTVDNTTDENGPGYAAFWKKGMGSGENTEKFLPGVSFRLTNNADASKVYTAVSGSDGLVLFEGIPAGEYTLQETGVPEGGEYEVSDKTYTVTVKGNQVNYPDGLQKDGNKPYILNQSEKGILKITKVDSTDRGVTLPDAEFALYGPYTSESAVPENPDEGDLAAELVTGADGTAASEPLETGWYLLRETKAPDTYAIMQRDTRVQITSNHTAALQIENAQRGALQIIKYGQLTLGSVATESRVPLAGAVFGVYTDPDCKTLAKDSNGNDARVTTRVSGNEPDTPAITLDPGTYYVQEISAPSGYQREYHSYSCH
ncbi:MAG: collagen binding domain-containing protein [[Clostridium] leptum]